MLIKLWFWSNLIVTDEFPYIFQEQFMLPIFQVGSDTE